MPPWAATGSGQRPGEAGGSEPAGDAARPSPRVVPLSPSLPRAVVDRAAAARTGARSRAPPPGGGVVRGERHAGDRHRARPGGRRRGSCGPPASSTSPTLCGRAAGPTRCLRWMEWFEDQGPGGALPGDRGARRTDVRADGPAGRDRAVGGGGRTRHRPEGRSPTETRWRAPLRTFGRSWAATASTPCDATRRSP